LKKEFKDELQMKVSANINKTLIPYKLYLRMREKLKG